MSYPLKKELAAGNRMLSFLQVAQHKGYRVTVYDPSQESSTAAFAAGGMLAPFSELENCETTIFKMGNIGLHLWNEWLKNKPSFHRKNGSLIIAHPRDQSLYEDFKEKILPLVENKYWKELRPSELEKDISNHYSKGLFFPLEQDLNPSLLLDLSLIHI